MKRLAKQQQVYHYNAEIQNTGRTKRILLSTTTPNDKYYTLKYDNTGLFGLRET